MTISIKGSSFVVNGSQSVSLASMLADTPNTTNPTYLVLTGLDRNEYTASATDTTGTLSGNGATNTFSSIGDDGRGIDIVFTYQASTGQYVNSTYGTLNQVTYTASASSNDVTSLSLFGTNSLSIANTYGHNVYSMIQVDAAGYIGSVTVATQPSFPGAVPAQATPNSIAAVAESFVGKAWNMDGCWVLASTIAADAGASLPITSTAIGVPGQSNGEWFVAYNGPAGQSGDWQSMVKAGEMIAFETSSGGGHITTVVSGSGSTAMLVDNITYVNGQGQVTNLAHDGSSADVVVAAPHAASQEWAGAPSNMVVIYELDTPIVSSLVTHDVLAQHSNQVLSSLFSAVDPAGKAVTEYQVYDTASSDSLTVGDVSLVAHSAASAVTAGSLSSISLVSGSAATTDILNVRAFNGSYWGDWQSLNVAISGDASPSASASNGSGNFTGSSSHYTLSLTAGSSLISVQDKVGSDGTQSVASGQLLQFTDQTINTAMLTQTAALPSAQLVELVDTYIAYFNRAPDAMGLDFWGSQLANGVSFSTIANGFSGSTEAIAAYPTGLSTQAFVTAVYNNVLGRGTDPSGLSFWSSELQSGAATKASFILNVVQSVLLQSGTADAQYIANKEAVGAHFALTQGLSDGIWAKTVMSGVSGTAASVTAANALTDGFAATAETAAGSELVVKILGIVA